MTNRVRLIRIQAKKSRDKADHIRPILLSHIRAAGDDGITLTSLRTHADFAGEKRDWLRKRLDELEADGSIWWDPKPSLYRVI